MPIQLYDSLERKVKPLQPHHKDSVFRMYCCGPTVYGPAHIGNFRTFIIQDVLRRVLELEFGPGKVKHVRNLTDVDDKTIKGAADAGMPLGEFTQKWTDKFHADCRALNLLEPHEEPKATDHIREQVEMIDTLLDKGIAYPAAAAGDGSVYYKIDQFKEYGKLSRLKERELKTGAARRASSVSADEYERDSVSDFALWKAWKPEDGPNKWPGPRGAAEGRPGWHIECSAMSRKHLGDTLDLHAGGVDLLFPHHENEIAQSEGCTGKPFARHWFHSEHLLVDGKKMSKSLGNLYTLDDLIAKGFSPMAIRYALLSGHPRKQLDFSLKSLHDAEKNLASLRAFNSRLRGVAGTAQPQSVAPKFPIHRVIEGLKDDLNVPEALGRLFGIINDLNMESLEAPHAASLSTGFDQVMYAFGMDLSNVLDQLSYPSQHILNLARQRFEAKNAKNYAEADRIRTEITALGWSISDTKDGGYQLEKLRRQ